MEYFVFSWCDSFIIMLFLHVVNRLERYSILNVAVQENYHSSVVNFWL